MLIVFAGLPGVGKTTIARELARRIGAVFVRIDSIEYGIRQLVEVAMRALSPGINDVFTALAVLDNLSASLACIFERGLEPSVLRDGQGRARVVRVVADHPGMVQAAFDQVRQAGGGMPAGASTPCHVPDS